MLSLGNRQYIVYKKNKTLSYEINTIICQTYVALGEREKIKERNNKVGLLVSPIYESGCVCVAKE